MCRGLILTVFEQNGLMGFVHKSSTNITSFVFSEESLQETRENL